MIRWKKNITVRTDKNSNVSINTDMGQTWNTFSIDANSRTPLSDWWNENYHNELREWQKDAVIKPLCDILGKGRLFVIYQRNNGTHQRHDLTMANWNDVWVLCTNDDLWLWKSTHADHSIPIEESFGSILDKSVRYEWYKVLDGLKTVYAHTAL